MTSRFLTDHGTKAQALRPSTVIHAARADLLLKARKKRDRSDEKLQAQHYTFHRRHVARSEDPKQLLARALRDRKSGEASGKCTTRIIYGDEELLGAALAMLEPRERAA